MFIASKSYSKSRFVSRVSSQTLTVEMSLRRYDINGAAETIFPMFSIYPYVGNSTKSLQCGLDENVHLSLADG